jgi:3-hydroxyacyl-[acyl-carrier-protein] dehydratase
MRPEELLPDRKPWILIDKVVQYVSGKQIVTKKHISTSDFFIAGHFPSYSVYPGMLLLEGLKQSAELLNYLSDHERSLSENSSYTRFLMTSCDARFLLPAVPGDTIEYIVELVSSVDGLFEYRGEGLKNDKVGIRAKWRAIGE